MALARDRPRRRPGARRSPPAGCHRAPRRAGRQRRQLPWPSRQRSPIVAADRAPRRALEKAGSDRIGRGRITRTIRSTIRCTTSTASIASAELSTGRRTWHCPPGHRARRAVVFQLSVARIKRESVAGARRRAVARPSTQPSETSSRRPIGRVHITPGLTAEPAQHLHRYLLELCVLPPASVVPAWS